MNENTKNMHVLLVLQVATELSIFSGVQLIEKKKSKKDHNKNSKNAQKF
jgi:hypothetical protein